MILFKPERNSARFQKVNNWDLGAGEGHSHLPKEQLSLAYFAKRPQTAEERAMRPIKKHSYSGTGKWWKSEGNEEAAVRWGSSDHHGGDTSSEPKEIRGRVLHVLVASGGGN